MKVAPFHKYQATNIFIPDPLPNKLALCLQEVKQAGSVFPKDVGNTAERPKYNLQQLICAGQASKQSGVLKNA